MANEGTSKRKISEILFGLQPLDDNSRLALLQILEDCYERKSVIITSQLPIAKWYDYIKEPTLADAIMDRLTANARRFHSVTAGTSIPLFTFHSANKILTLSLIIPKLFHTS
jgi:hypothetical protein